MYRDISKNKMRKYFNSKIFITLVGFELAVYAGVLVVIFPDSQPNTRATILMTLGLIISWVVVGGILMRVLRDPLRSFFQTIKFDPRIAFVLLATCLALIEELITTTLTNLAPTFGVNIGDAYITASSNYLDVVCFHSVSVFIPMFICWAFLINRYSFDPNAVFLLFGATGVAAEMMYGGSQALLGFGLWVFVYGLMVYLPAYVFRTERKTKQPHWWHYAAAILLPLVFAIPVAIVIGFAHPMRVHFLPMRPGS
jgi:hypothetical protein